MRIPLITVGLHMQKNGKDYILCFYLLFVVESISKYCCSLRYENSDSAEQSRKGVRREPIRDAY